jgi:hypothetical protein
MTIYGQEKDNATWALAVMNMYLHNNEIAVIHKGDTITGPQFTQGAQLETFDFVVMNPPFSYKSWSNGLENDYGRFEFGTGRGSSTTEVFGFDIPDLELTKSGQYQGVAGRAEVGDEIEWTFSVTNTGNVTLDNVVVTDAGCDAAPVHVSGDGNANGKLDVGETWVFECTSTIDQGDIDAGGVTNSAMVSADDPNGDEVTDKRGGEGNGGAAHRGRFRSGGHPRTRRPDRGGPRAGDLNRRHFGCRRGARPSGHRSHRRPRSVRHRRRRARLRRRVGQMPHEAWAYWPWQEMVPGYTCQA